MNNPCVVSHRGPKDRDITKVLADTNRGIEQAAAIMQRAANEIVYLRAKVTIAQDALAKAEAFIAGFEDDEAQEGIAALLAEIRAARGVS